MECKIAFEALFVLEEEKLAENAEKVGHLFRDELNKPKKIITLVRGKGLLNVIVINEKIDAWDICVVEAEGKRALDETYACGHIIRLVLPLIITERRNKYARYHF